MADVGIGDQMPVGHQAMLHGCSVGNGSLIGIQTVILNGARIGKGCLVGTCPLVTEGKQFADQMLILGAPAVPALTGLDIVRLQESASNYTSCAALDHTYLKKIGST